MAYRHTFSWMSQIQPLISKEIKERSRNAAFLSKIIDICHHLLLYRDYALCCVCRILVSVELLFRYLQNNQFEIIQTAQFWTGSTEQVTVLLYR